MIREQAEKELRDEGLIVNLGVNEAMWLYSAVTQRLALRRVEAERDVLKGDVQTLIREGRESAALIAQHSARLAASEYQRGIKDIEARLTAMRSEVLKAIEFRGGEATMGETRKLWWFEEMLKITQSFLPPLPAEGAKITLDWGTGTVPLPTEKPPIPSNTFIGIDPPEKP